MVVVRADIWETNSSSSHVVCVTKNDTHIKPEELHGDKYPDEYNDEFIYSLYDDGKWRLREVDDGYGRYPFQILTTFKDKFKYALCEYCGYYYGDEPKFKENYEMIENLAREIVPGCKELSLHTRDVDIYLDEDGNELNHSQLKYEEWDSKNEHEIYSYVGKDGNRHNAIFDEENYLEVPAIGVIDHQSAGLLTNFLKEKGITLKEFLTNKKYAVVVDGDEFGYLDRYIRCGFINADFITEIFTTSGEDLEYQEWLKQEKENENESNTK